MKIRITFLSGLFFLLFFTCSAQYPPLPDIRLDRRAAPGYLDSLAEVGKARYRLMTKLSGSPVTDTLRLKSLYFLGRVYKNWYGRRDSMLYYSQQMVREARQRKNLFFVVNGLLLQEEYYRVAEKDPPRALRINLDILKMIPPLPVYRQIRFQTNVRLGSLYGLMKDYPLALSYMKTARVVISPDTLANPRMTYSLLIDLEQQMGAVYQQQKDFLQAERHFRSAERMLRYSPSAVEHAYVYDDLAGLYLAQNQFDSALVYAKKAEAIWKNVRTSGESQGWGTLAVVYSGLKKDSLATVYAGKVLALPKPNRFILEDAYKTLYEVAGRRHEWKDALLFYRNYKAVRDTIDLNKRSSELALIHKQEEYNRLAIRIQQAEQLQAERLRNIRRQAELVRLRAEARAKADRQERLLARQQTQLLLVRQQAAQKLQQQAFREQSLQSENNKQKAVTVFGVVSGLLVTGILMLALIGTQLARAKTLAELNMAGMKNEANVQILNAQEAERRRIAQDLHDGIGISLITLRGKLSENDTEAQLLINRLIDDVRAVSHNLMPDELDTLGLIGALSETTRRMRGVTGIAFVFLYAGDVVTLSPSAELAIYRAVLELMNNIVRHSQATEAVIQLVYHTTLLNVTVEDNGKGFINKTEGKVTGIGLKNVASRTEWLGGQMAVDSSAHGTTIRLDIPYS